MLKYAAYEIADLADQADQDPADRKPEEPSQLRRALPWLAGLAGVGTAGYLASRFLGGSAPAPGHLMSSLIGVPRQAFEGVSTILGQGPGNALTHGVMTGVVGGAARATADHLHTFADKPGNLSIERLQLLNNQKSVPGGAPGRFGASIGLTDPTDVAQVQAHAGVAAKQLGYATPEEMFSNFRRQGFQTLGDARKSFNAAPALLPPGAAPRIQSGLDSLDDMAANIRTNRMTAPGRLGRAAGAVGVGIGSGALGSYLSDWGRNTAAEAQ